MRDGPNDIGLSRRHLAQALDDSLAAARRRAHRPLPDARLGRADPARGDPALPRRRRSAPARSPITASPIFSAGTSPRRCTWPRRITGPAPVTLQPQYSLLVREIEHEIVPACADAGIGLLPWSPLGGGWLTGKYKRDVMPTGATRLGENPKRGMEAYRAAQCPGAHLGDHRRGGRNRQGARRQLGAGRARLGRRAAGGDLGDPRRPHRRAARRQSRRRGPDADRRPNSPGSSDVSAPQIGDYPYGKGGTQQRLRKIEGGR